MKTRFFSLYLLVFGLLVAGCMREEDGGRNDGRIHLFAERMDRGAKVLVDPTSYNNASWVAGEKINLNGTPCTIACSDGQYYLEDVEPMSVDGYAIYPATLNENGNDIAVTNNGPLGCAIDIHTLAVNLHPDGKHDVIFPMASHLEANGTSMLFKHLTGGLRMTIIDSLTSDAPFSFAKMVIYASNSNYGPAIYKDVVPEWADVTLPGLPSGDVGRLGLNYNAQFVGEMTLMVNTVDNTGNVTPGCTLNYGESVSFCFPMLAKDLLTLYIVFKDENDMQVFEVYKSFGNAADAIDVERNHMYNTPDIVVKY